MKVQHDSSASPQYGVFDIFGKVYNLFYCRKAEQAPAVEGDDVGERQDTTSLSDNEWFKAIKTNDAAVVSRLLDTGQVDLSAADQFGWPALHLCAWNGYTDLCALLISSKCDINLPGPGQSTALSLACQKGYKDIVNMLLRAQCHVHTTAQLGPNQDVTALHLASQNGHVDIVQMLLQAGASANVCMTAGGVKGVTPLHLAVEAGHLDVMDVLIDAGCDVQSSTKPNTETDC